MLSALAVGCGGSDVDQQPVQGGNKKEVVTVNATLPSDLVWAAGDKVAINGLESVAVTAEGAGSATYAFETSKVSAPVVVVSPYEIMTGKGEVTLPSTQDYVADGVDRAAYGLAGIAAELVADPENEKKFTVDVQLNPVMGIVSLPLTLDAATAENPVSIKQVSFTALNNAAINGTWNAEVVTATDEYGVSYYDIKLTSVKGSSTVNLACGEGVAIDTYAPVYFNLVVPAATYTGGFEVVVTDTADHNYILTLSEDVVVERGATAELAPSVFTVVEKAPATLTVTIAQPGVVWQEGDAVVCNNTLSTTTVTGAAVGGQTAEFAFDAVAYPYSVFYPAEYYTTSGSLRFYDAQPLIKDGYDRKNLVMVGYSNTTEVTLNNLCGIVSIPVTNKYEGETIVIDKVEVTTAEGDAIAGKYHINYRTGELTLASGKSSIVLTPETEGAFAIEPEATATISFVVPRGSIRNGLKLNIHSSVGILENHSVFPTGLTVRGGETATADVYEYKEVKIEKIMTAEELLDFAKCVNIGRYKKYVNEEGKVVLGGDIDMSTIEWTPIVGVANADGIHAGFDGTFDGCGFSIKNWATAQPLFGYLAATGTVSNLVIDQSCGLTIPAVLPYTIDGKATSNTCFGFVVATNFGVVENITNNAEVTTLCADDTKATARAAIVGFNAIGGYVKGCINNAAVTYDLGNHSANTGYLGTVVGRAQSAAEVVPAGIYNCENHGKFTVNILDGNTTKNFYIGGVTGSSNSYTVTSGCKNTGDITWNTPYSGAAVVMGGVTSYSAGKIENCHNEGNILFNNSGNIKGTCIGGIVCYQNGEITGCTNKGNITAYGKKFEGRNTIGSIDAGTNATSSPAPTFAGIIAFGYNSAGSPFSMSDCVNHGNISFTWTEADGSGTSGRVQVAGVAGAPWGDVVNCHNYGDLNFDASVTATPVNHLSYIGGVVASDYYAKSQSESSIIDCTNEGDINIKYYLGNTSNSAAGGIVGWPGAESNCTNVTQNCVNKGNITFSGNGLFRLGGIQGGSGHIVDCVNEGNITINDSNAGSKYGGLAGFHSGGYLITGSTNTGNVVCNVPLATGGVGGMSGNFGNSEHLEGKMKNNTIKCIVKAAEGTCGVGLIAGHFNGNTKTIYFGTADEPIKVGGSVIIGDTTTVVDATNYNSPSVLGSGCSYFLETAHIYNVVLAE